MVWCCVQMSAAPWSLGGAICVVLLLAHRARSCCRSCCSDHSQCCRTTCAPGVSAYAATGAARIRGFQARSCRDGREKQEKHVPPSAAGTRPHGALRGCAGMKEQEYSWAQHSYCLRRCSCSFSPLALHGVSASCCVGEWRISIGIVRGCFS